MRVSRRKLIFVYRALPLSLLYLTLFLPASPSSVYAEKKGNLEVFTPYFKATAVCSGKYKKSQNLGFEIINVRCPSLTDTCTCEIDKKFNNLVRCGTEVKKSSFEANLVDCESRFIVEDR